MDGEVVAMQNTATSCCHRWQTRSCSLSEEVDFPESDLESTKVCCWLGDAHWYEVAWNANGLVAKAVVAARSKRTAGLTRCVLRFIKMQLLP